MTLYHVRSPVAADDIRVRGFTGSIDPETGIAGVRFADRPIGFTHAHGAVVVIEIPEHLVRKYELCFAQKLDENFFRAFELPIELVNQYPVRIDTSDV